MTWNATLKVDDEGNITGKVVGQVKDAPKTIDVSGYTNSAGSSLTVRAAGLQANAYAFPREQTKT